MNKKKVSGRQAALDFLREQGGGPLPIKTVTAEAAARARMKGKTPAATVSAQLYTAAKKGHLVKIPSRGMVELLPEPAHAEGEAAAVSAADVEEAQPEPEPEPIAGREAKPHPKPGGGKRSRQRETVAA